HEHNAYQSVVGEIGYDQIRRRPLVEKVLAAGPGADSWPHGSTSPSERRKRKRCIRKGGAAAPAFCNLVRRQRGGKAGPPGGSACSVTASCPAGRRPIASAALRRGSL